MVQWLRRFEIFKRAGEHPGVHVSSRHSSLGALMNGMKFVIALALLALLAAGFIILGIPDFGT
jgi:hypothetical protein